MLISIQSLLCDPNPHDVQNPEAGRLYLEDPELYEQIVVEWKFKYCPNY